MSKIKKRILTWLLTQSKSTYSRIFVVLLIIMLGFIVYSNSISNPFIWDDNKIVKDNPFIRDWSNAPKLLSSNLASDSTFYRPVQVLSYMVDYSLFSLNVKGYHLTNCLLHILVALSIFWLVILLFSFSFLSSFSPKSFF